MRLQQRFDFRRRKGNVNGKRPLHQEIGELICVSSASLAVPLRGYAHRFGETCINGRGYTDCISVGVFWLRTGSSQRTILESQNSSFSTNPRRLGRNASLPAKMNGFTNDLTNGVFNNEITTNLSERTQYGAINIHKRPWPFDVDDQHLMSSDSGSPSPQQPAEPLWLLGSVSNDPFTKSTT